LFTDLQERPRWQALFKRFQGGKVSVQSLQFWKFRIEIVTHLPDQMGFAMKYFWLRALTVVLAVAAFAQDQPKTMPVPSDLKPGAKYVMQYPKEAKEIWDKFAPKSGQARTVQGELLRAVEKLRDEAARNGNQNWDRGFKILAAYLEDKLTDTKVFSAAKIAETRTILARLRHEDEPYVDDDFYDFLSDRVVEYFKFYGSRPHVNNPRLNR
jgi:hypothetical protein